MRHFLEKEGFKVNLSILEWGTYMSAFKSGNFDIVIGQWIGFTGPDMLKYAFYSKNIPPVGGNRISYNNPEFDKVIDEATVETNGVKRTNFTNRPKRLLIAIMLISIYGILISFGLAAIA